ncbi:MAG: hypothetical protein MZV65_21325 [Chromatiales bacterium]|nr:hypothetical protein [Chromatiales bacterium]
MNPLRLFRLIGARKRRDLELFPPWLAARPARCWRTATTGGTCACGCRSGFSRSNLGGHDVRRQPGEPRRPDRGHRLRAPVPRRPCGGGRAAMTIDFRALGDQRPGAAPRFPSTRRHEAAHPGGAGRPTGRSTPSVRVPGFYRADGALCTHVDATRWRSGPRVYQSPGRAPTARPQASRERHGERLPLFLLHAVLAPGRAPAAQGVRGALPRHGERVA